jgi:hypothetical protein
VNAPDITTTTQPRVGRYQRAPRTVALRSHGWIAVEVTPKGRVKPLLDTLRPRRIEALEAAYGSEYRCLAEHVDVYTTAMRVALTGEGLSR